MTAAVAEPRPAATIVVLRDQPGGVEVLLVQRHTKSPFMPGATVFPGGKVDPADREPGDDDQTAARRAAIRELAEEAGIVVEPTAEIACFAHWVTPAFESRRFDTLFFAVVAPADQVAQADRSETTDALWLTFDEALDGGRPDVFLPPPTRHTLERLRALGGDAATLVRKLTAEGVGPRIEPHVVIDGPGLRCIALPWDREAPGADAYVNRHGADLRAMTAVAALPVENVPGVDRYDLREGRFCRQNDPPLCSDV